MNKLRYILIGVMLSYCCFLIYSMVSTYIYSNKEISVDIDANYYNLVDILEKKIEGIKEDELTKKSKVCFELIKNIKNQSTKEVTTIIDKKYITDIFDPKRNYNPISYLKAWENCELSKRDKAIISPLIIASMSSFVGPEQKIAFNYEFKLENKKIKSSLEADITDFAYSNMKNSEILTAINLMDTLKYGGEEINNE